MKITPYTGSSRLLPIFPGIFPTTTGHTAHLPGQCIIIQYIIVLFAILAVHFDHFYQPKSCLEPHAFGQIAFPPGCLP